MQSSYNAASQYCASWWLDVGKNVKINIDDICYTWEFVTGMDPTTGEPIWQRNGCLHQAPVPNAIPVAGPDTTTSPVPVAAAPMPGTTNPARRMLRTENAPEPASVSAAETADSPDESIAEEDMPQEYEPDMRVLRTREDVVDVASAYSDTGREYDALHTAWYGCKKGTATGTPLNGEARIICQNDVASLAFKMDSETIQLLLQLIQVCSASAP